MKWHVANAGMNLLVYPYCQDLCFLFISSVLQKNQFHFIMGESSHVTCL